MINSRDPWYKGRGTGGREGRRDLEGDVVVGVAVEDAGAGGGDDGAQSDQTLNEETARDLHLVGFI